MSPDLKNRLTTSSLAILFLTTIIALSHIQALSWCITILLSLIVSVSLREYTALCEKKGRTISSVFLMASTIVFYCSRYVALHYPSLFFLPPCALFCIALSLFVRTLHHNHDALSTLSLSLFGFVYIALPLSWSIDIHFSSTFWLVWLLVTVKGSDVAAYVVGKCCGKHPLAPTVSPKKTIEGALASILGAALLSLLLSPFSPTPLPLKSFFSLGSSIGALAILGDLSESLIKRDANVKDSSTIPGLGGALDSIDSLLFATPCLYFYLKINHQL